MIYISVSSSSAFGQMSNTNQDPEETHKIIYEYLSILSLLLVPRIALAKTTYTMANYFADDEGWIPTSVSVISITIVTLITILLYFLIAKFLSKYIYNNKKYTIRSSTNEKIPINEKMRIYKWFSQIIICIPIIVALISGSYILYQSFTLEKDLNKWDGINSNEELQTKLRTYYLNTLQKIVVIMTLIFLIILFIYCIVAVMTSNALQSSALVNSPDQDEFTNKIRSTMLNTIVNGALLIGCVGCFALAALAFSGALFGNSPILSKILAAIAMALASALLKALLSKLFGDFFKSLFSGLFGLGKKGASKSNTKDDDDL